LRVRIPVEIGVLSLGVEAPGPARREEGAYRAYATDEQRRGPGWIGGQNGAPISTGILSRRTVLTSMALAAAAGCRRDAATEAGVPTVALVMKSLANEFFKTMEEGARRHHAERADEYRLIINGIKDEQDVGRQIDLVGQMVAQHVDGLVLAPADSRALVGALRRAADAGVVVVNIDNKLDPAVLAERDLVVPFVGPDNRKGARLAGAHLAGTLGRGGRVATIEGLPTADNAIQRRLGFEDAIAEGGLELVASQAGNWEMSRGNQVAAALLTAHPGLQGLMCANDSMALGAAAAVRAAGRTGQVLIVGFDNISAVQDLIRSGEILATVEQHAADLAAFGIDYALEILRTGAAPADRETPVDLITADTLAP
jgi:ribose transport system substrate-binding protein